MEALKESIKTSQYRCPACKGISTDPYECNSGIVLKNIKDGEDRPCNWKVYGLFRIGGVTLFLKDKMLCNMIFKPIAWETKQEVRD